MLCDKEMAVFNSPKAVDFRTQLREISAIMEQGQYRMYLLNKLYRETEKKYRIYLGLVDEGGKDVKIEAKKIS